MRIHRFYAGDHIKLKKDFWLHDEALLWQWNKVLRFQDSQQVILFDANKTERLYKIEKLVKTEAHLIMITEYEPKLPAKHVYLFWSMLKRDNNEHIIQKATELGVSNFVPLITERTIKKDFNHERAQKIIIEASEQCGRTDIPHIREPIHLTKALPEYADKLTFYICQQGHDKQDITETKIGLLIGPEGGWSPNEIEFFRDAGYKHLAISDFVLRAETAAVVAAASVL